MRRIHCIDCGADTDPRDPPTRINFGRIIKEDVLCDLCSVNLDVGVNAFALSMPADMGIWESGYFDPVSLVENKLTIPTS